MPERKQTVRTIKLEYRELSPVLRERSRRLWAATEAKAWGRAASLPSWRPPDWQRIRFGRGLADLAHPAPHAAPPSRIRRAGGGRKKLAEKDPGLTKALDALIKPAAAGSPAPSAPRWTCESATNPAETLTKQGHPAAQRTVGNLLHEQKCRLQAHRKTREGNSHHPDRDARFKHINDSAGDMQTKHQPVTSVDAKKKE